MHVAPALRRRGRQMPGTGWSDSLAEILSSRFSENPCLKTEMGEDNKYLSSIAHTEVCISVHTHNIRVYQHTEKQVHKQKHGLFLNWANKTITTQHF